MATTSSPQSSWQPHHHASSWEVWEIRNAWIQAWKHSRARNPVFFRVKWLPWSPKEDLCFRGSIGGSGRQNVHRTVARARFPLENVKKLSRSEHFWKMGSAKGAPDYIARARFHIKSVKNCPRRGIFGRWGRQKPSWQPHHHLNHHGNHNIMK